MQNDESPDNSDKMHDDNSRESFDDIKETDKASDKI